MADAASPSKIDPAGLMTLSDIQKFITSVRPQVTDTTERSTPDPAAMANSNSVLAQAQAGITDPADAMVQNILQRSAQEFLPGRREQNVAGLYNSSTMQQMMDEARARATGEAAKAVKDFQASSMNSAAQITNEQLRSTATKSKQEVKQPAISANMMSALIAGGSMLAKNVFADSGKRAPVIDKSRQYRDPEARNSFRSGEEEDALANAAGSGGAGSAGSNADASSAVGGVNQDASLDNSTFLNNSFAENTFTTTAGLSAADGVIYDSAADLSPEELAEISTEAGEYAAGTDFSWSAVDDFGSEAADVAGDVAGAGLEMSVPYVSIAKILGSEDFLDISEIQEFSSFVSQGVGEVAEDLWQGAEDIASDVADISVICTELVRQKLLDEQLYLSGRWYSGNVPAHIKDGYHFWAKPYVRLMQRSTLATAVARPFAIGRYTYLTGKWNLCGWLTVVVGEPVCSLIGKCMQLGVKHGTAS